MAVAVFERAEDLGDRHDRVRRSAAVNTRMQIVSGAFHSQFGIPMPRSPTQIVGSSGANISVSQITAASAFSRSGLDATYSSICSRLSLLHPQSGTSH